MSPWSFDAFANMLWEQVLRQSEPAVRDTMSRGTYLFAHVDKSTLRLLSVPLVLHLNPLRRLRRERLRGQS